VGGRSSRHRWGWRGTASNFHGDLCTVPELLWNTTTIRGNQITGRKLTAWIESFRPSICIIPGREAAVSREVIPL